MNDGATRVLLVEDSPAFAGLMDQFFLDAEAEGERFALAHAGSTEEALGYLERHGVDVVLLDLNLPDTRGLDTVRAVSGAVPDTPIVVLSGLADRGVAVEAIAEGVQDYLVKSEANPDLLARTLRYAIERRAAAREREEFNRRIQHTQKLESLGVLAGGIANDFNNLLIGILGYADMALMELPETDSCSEHVREIKSLAQHLAGLTRQMLAYSGKGPLAMEPLQINRLITEMSPLLDVVVTRRITLNVELSDGLPPVDGDPSQLRQVVLNLLINAVESLGVREGTITLRTGALEADAKLLRRAVLGEQMEPGEMVFVEITDNGPGMDQQTVARIFDPFFTTKEAGRGLGLAATLGIVRSHNGAIEVRSEPEQGSTFRVLLPMGTGVEREFESVAELIGATMPRPLGEGAILIVEDEEPVRRVMQGLLERAGFAIQAVGSGPEAAAALDNPQKQFGLVILDLTMPQWSAEETMQEVVHAQPTIPIILTSGFAARDLPPGTVAGNVVGYLQKPFNYEELITHVRDVLGTR